MEEPLQGVEVGDRLCATRFMLGWMFLMANRAEFMRYSKIGLLWKWSAVKLSKARSHLALPTQLLGPLLFNPSTPTFPVQ